ncbi:uncharacterized protein [Palaemon carinicauda]|uniref:uncharacterized protein n=1 Tax=Palaemon carinicauda TaxID=392227 RepID=UPI0035B68044
MKIFNLSLLLSLVSTLQAGKLRGCIETDVCTAIVFNQLILQEYKNAMGEVTKDFKLQLLNAAEEMREAVKNLTAFHALSLFDPEVLEKCHRETNSVNLDITRLELDLSTPMLDEVSYQKNMASLRGEKQTLQEEVKSLEVEIQEVIDVISGQQGHIDALLGKITKFGTKLPENIAKGLVPVESICSASAST